jgi:tape measure domain-containing protein
MNNGFTYSIAFQWANSPLNSLLGKLNGINRTIDSMRLRINSNTNAMNRFANSGNNSVSGLNSGMTNLLGTIGTVGLATKSMHDAMDRQGSVNAINFASGGVAQGTENINHIRETVEKLGLPLKESMDGFKLLDASIMGTGMSQKFARDMFDSTGMAATVLGMKAEQTSAAYRALGQMASKGVVSMEELKGQLGDALPGAASIAARAMNMPIDKFNKMVESGHLLAKDFLPKFAAEMKNTFEGKVSASINSATANYARFQNSLSDLSVIVGERLLPPVLSFMKNYLIPAAGWIGKHIDLLSKWAINVGVLYGSWKVYNTVAEIAAWRTALLGTEFTALSGATLAQSIANIGLTSSVWALTTAMLMNPITWIAAGIIAFGGAIYYAYQNSIEFRATIGGLWAVLKKVGHDVVWLKNQIWNFAQDIYTKYKPAFDFFGKILYDMFVYPIQKIIELLGWWYSKVAEFFGLLDVFNKGYNNTVIEEYYGKNTIAINKTTEAVLGLNDAYEIQRNLQNSLPKGMGYTSVSSMPFQEKVIGNSKYFFDPYKPNEELKPGKGVKDNIKGITEGGKSTKVITFQNVTLVKEFNQNVQNIQEGAAEAKEIIIREFLQLLNSANQMQ